MTDTRLWLLAVGLALGTTVSNGYARFAYGLVLPAMRQDLSWSYTEAGWINTANALGYLAGAVWGMRLIARVDAGRLFAVATVLTALFVVACAATAAFPLLLALRIATGVAGALTFIAGAALSAALFAGNPSKSALALALYFGGGGLGLLTAGLGLPLLLDATGPAGWPWAWGLLGGTSLVLSVPSVWAGLSLRAAAGPPPGGAWTTLPIGRFWRQTLAYFLFAVGYLVYLTFMTAWMRNEGADAGRVALTWTILGAAAMASPFLWRRVLARSAGGGAIAAALAATAAGTLVPLIVDGIVGLVASAALFGGAFLIVPTAATAFARKNLDPTRIGTAVAFLTVVFAAGQTIGPVAAGAIADLAGSIETGLAAAGALLLLGAVVGSRQRPLGPAV